MRTEDRLVSLVLRVFLHQRLREIHFMMIIVRRKGGFKGLHIGRLVYPLDGADEYADFLREHDLCQGQHRVSSMDQVSLEFVCQGVFTLPH